MVTDSETEEIKRLMMVGYGDLQLSHQDICDLFNKIHLDRNPIFRPTVSKLLGKFREAGHVKANKTIIRKHRANQLEIGR